MMEFLNFSLYLSNKYNVNRCRRIPLKRTPFSAVYSQSTHILVSIRYKSKGSETWCFLCVWGGEGLNGRRNVNVIYSSVNLGYRFPVFVRAEIQKTRFKGAFFDLLRNSCIFYPVVNRSYK